MINRELEAITEADLLGLIQTPVVEGDRIEYKAQLNLDSDADKKKFVASVASFANASGGDMVFGMVAKEGRPVSLQALAGFSADETFIRIRDLVLAGIEPPIYTVEYRAVPLAVGGEIAVVRISKTWAGAHMVTYNGDNRFYTRHGGARRMMDVTEIRSAFTLAEAITERIQRWRLERIGNILAGETPHPLNGRAALVIHLIPLRAFDATFAANLRVLKSTQLKPISASGWDTRIEFDGMYAFDRGENQKGTGYVYVFRNGSMEILDTGMLEYHGAKRLIVSIGFEQDMMEHLPNWLAALREMGVEAPVVLSLSLLNTKDYGMGVNAGQGGLAAHRITRDMLHTPATVLESLSIGGEAQDQPVNVCTVMRPHIDAIWNACGYERSPYFSQEGKWLAGRHRH